MTVIKYKKKLCKLKNFLFDEECQKLNARFFNFHQKNIPYIILKWAQTNDGFIDIKRNENKRRINWITEKETQVLVHKWRREEESILIGVQTLIDDNPKLTNRYFQGRSPVKIIFDPNNRADENSDFSLIFTPIAWAK